MLRRIFFFFWREQCFFSAFFLFQILTLCCFVNNQWYINMHTQRSPRIHLGPRDHCSVPGVTIFGCLWSIKSKFKVLISTEFWCNWNHKKSAKIFWNVIFWSPKLLNAITFNRESQEKELREHRQKFNENPK